MTVVALAHQMYESRDFSPMPILADALSDADCLTRAYSLTAAGRNPTSGVAGYLILYSGEGDDVTEQEWLTATDPTPMLEFLRGGASDRKLRLFACACCRRFWNLLLDARSRKAVVVAEAFADSLASELDLATAGRETCQAARAVTGLPDMDNLQTAVALAAWEAANLADMHLSADWAINRSRMVGAVLSQNEVTSDHDTDAMRRVKQREFNTQCHVLRDIFGNPYRRVTANPGWLSSTVLALAAGIYREKAFDRLPILADALQDAGCDNDEILSHCRGTGPHVRGCWVVDLLLGKG